jgi:hypothetical protein
MEALRELYYDPKLGVLTENKLYAKAKSLGLVVTHKLVHEFLQSQEVAQVFKPVRIKHYYPLIATAPFQRLQVDLLDMSNQAIRGYKWIYCAVDVYSRFAICVPLKSKTTGECVRALNETLKQIRHINAFTPSQIDSDSGVDSYHESTSESAQTTTSLKTLVYQQTTNRRV